MSKILITGMTASQASNIANVRSRQFADMLYTTLTAGNHNVIWESPELFWQPKELTDYYDAILVGISPLTGLPANRVYGALSTIHKLWCSEKLFFFIDAPEPSQITASLASVYRGSSDLFKPFYSYRRNYSDASEGKCRERIESAVELLNIERWPVTIYPSLPWEQKPLSLNMENVGLPLGLNFDAFSIIQNRPLVSPRENVWAIDSYRTKWSLTTAKGLVYPTTPMRQSKGSTDWDVARVMDSALGSIISPQKSGGTWWNYRYAQSMNALTPVATEWRESSAIGHAWNYLPAAIEGLSENDRFDLAHEQKTQYLSAINDTDTALFELESLLGLAK